MSQAASAFSAIVWDEALIDKYNLQGPRYTSYPTALQFVEGFDMADLEREAHRHSDSIAPVSLYVHVPFCSNICYYCACNKIITKDKSQARAYLDHLAKEIAMQSKLYGKSRPVTQLHWGGGTPTFLSPAEMTELMYLLASHFHLVHSPSREYSIEIDPRTLKPNTMALLKGLGFNRISLGVQDFDERVQKAINRIQSFDSVADVVSQVRAHGFKSLSFDLIYGLPHQSPASMAETVDKVLSLSPDRISFYNYAHMPHLFIPQRAIDRLTLPTPQQKLEMLHAVIDRFTEAGYLYIGMDHFVKPGDDLAIAAENGRLQRNFQGYSTCLAPDLVGLGVSSISQVGRSYTQNAKELDAYYALIEKGELPIVKGLHMNDDDLVRKDVIMSLICKLELDPAAIEQSHDIDFDTYFAEEKADIDRFIADGLLAREGAVLKVTAAGRLLIRAICMAFDAYARRPAEENVEEPRRHSKVI